jgi:hypothetical protein
VNKDKYGKYIVKEPRGTDMISPIHLEPFFHVVSTDYWKGSAFGIGFNPVLRPWLMEKAPMKHDFDQILCFLGGDLSNIFDFGAEIELCLGEEQEIHIINTASIVYIPKGLVHCPLNFKIIKKPVLFVDVTLTPEYTRAIRENNNWKTLTGEDAHRQ